MILQAKDFFNRKQLESHINAEIGNDMTTNRAAGHIIKGTREEMAKLRLDDTVTVWGIKCEITDTKTKDNLGKKSAQLIQEKKNK